MCIVMRNERDEEPNDEREEEMKRREYTEFLARKKKMVS